jgi:pilus assembly protein CpaF
MAGLDLPVRAIRQQISGAINLIVHLGRLADGSRRVMSIVELTGFDDPTIALQELFVSEATAGGAQGRIRLTPTGTRPRIMDKIHRLGVEAPETAAFRRGIADRATHTPTPTLPHKGGGSSLLG